MIEIDPYIFAASYLAVSGLLIILWALVSEMRELRWASEPIGKAEIEKAQIEADAQWASILRACRAVEEDFK